MPYHYVIDTERRLVISTGWDRLTFAEIKAHQDQFTSDPDFDPTFNQLIDATAITALDLSIDEARTIASRHLFSSTARRAFLATSPAIFGMGRLLEAYHGMAEVPEQVCVFSDRASALKWLGLEALPEPITAKEAKKAEGVKAAGNNKNA